MGLGTVNPDLWLILNLVSALHFFLAFPRHLEVAVPEQSGDAIRGRVWTSRSAGGLVSGIFDRCGWGNANAFAGLEGTIARVRYERCLRMT